MENTPSAPKKLLQKVSQLILAGFSVLYNILKVYQSRTPGKVFFFKMASKIVEKHCRARGLNTEDAMCRSRWRKQIGMIDDHDECSG